MAQLWRLHTKTDSNTGANIADYCLKKHVLAMGWSLKDSHLEDKQYHITTKDIEIIKTDRSLINNFDKYKEILEYYKVYYGKVNGNVNNLYKGIQPGDLIWLKQKGKYYLGRASENSVWQYVGDQEALDLDASNQRNNIEWLEIGDESAVPGAVATAFILGHTLQRIQKGNCLAYSQLLYNEKSGKHLYDTKIPTDSKSFYAMLSSSDCEDLLCLWLFAKFGYVCIPSTDKAGTELYECVLIDPKTGKHIYPQVKNGSEDLFPENYLHLLSKKDATGNIIKLNNEVWLLTVNGKVKNSVQDSDYEITEPGKDYKYDQRVHVADPEALFMFALGKTNFPVKADNILPDSIKRWAALIPK